MSGDDTPRIGKYQVVARVAAGSLAEVLKARLDGIAGFSRLFAIKRVHPAVAERTAWVERIEAEARRAATLAHSNLVQVLDLGHDGGRPYLVVEWVDGWSLARVLEQAREEDDPLPVGHVAWIGVQVLQALEYAHGQSAPLVHDAISPSNVLISRGGEVKLSDFGLGRVADALSQEAPEVVPRRVLRDVPETAEGGTPGVAGDLFSVGAVLYEALALTHPFLREDDEATLAALAAGEWPGIATLRDDVPDEMAAAIDAALHHDPAERPESATAFKQVLVEVLRQRAGDVFTQETLARGCRELFGEPATGWSQDGPRPVSVDLDDDALQLMDEPVEDDLDLEDLPSVADVEMPIDAEKTTPAATAMPRDDDVHTAVSGSMPPAPPPPKRDDWDDEGATRIDPEMAKKLAELRERKAAADKDPTRMRAGALDIADVEQVARRSWLATVAVAALMLALGVSAGALGAMAWGRSAGMTVMPPVLEVHTPSDLTVDVVVDGTAAVGRTGLTAGEHTVEITAEGRAPWTVDLVLEPGEYRLMVVEAHTLPPETARADDDETDDDTEAP